MRGEYGNPGGSLADTYGAAGDAGKYGEMRTAEVLSGFASRCVVVHDVIVPGLSANLDHIVISGSRVLILDSKAWRDGFYHRLSDAVMRRGHDEVTHDSTEGLLRMQSMFAESVAVTSIRSKLIVWPSRNARQVMIDPSLHSHTVPVYPGHMLTSIVRRFIGLRLGARRPLSEKIISHAHAGTTGEVAGHGVR